MVEQDAGQVTRPRGADGLVLEAWGQGLMVGSLLIMAVVTLSNMKRHILLHKLIFAEVRKPRSTTLPHAHHPLYS